MKLKSLLNSILMIILLFGGVLFFTGCEKEKISHTIEQNDEAKKMIKELNVFDQYTFEIVITETGVVYPDISDELFAQITSGYISLPLGTKPSAKFKAIILEQMSGIEKKLADKKGLYLDFTPEMVELYESDRGETAAEEWYDYLVSSGIDPSLPQEKQNQILEERDRHREQIQSRTSNACVFTYVPHYYEWNTSENPNHYNWCGHASLKGVAHKHGTLKNLGQIHTAFCNNSPSGYCPGNRCVNDPGNYCASLLDLFYMADNNPSKTWNYNFPTSTLESVTSLANFYQRAKDGIDNHKPLIIPSTYSYSYGHFYAVIGYETYYNSNGTINYNTSQIYVRDVAYASPLNYYWDRKTSVSNFYSKRNGNQVLFVRPGLV